ncbi:MAG: hypothetical protein JWM98_2492 [Thermoleophilia bacterium]|nr:hypothetical protein [Thermoleophilia bacterium]
MSTLQRHAISVDELRSTFGFGVAGNFAGHLEQAGEAADFTNVEAAAELPKGIFPWFVPGSGGRLGAFPLSSDTLAVPPPPGDAPLRIQVEPELAVLCDVVRDAAGEVARLAPRWVAAFDDCSLRRPGANKISDKKNWGAASKGLAPTAFAATELAADGPLASLRLACFLRRGDVTAAYGVDSAVATYTLFGEPLLDWLVDRLRLQRGSDDTPLEDVGAMLDASTATSVLVGVGASRYEPFGETTFVEPGDEAVVVLYDSRTHAPADVAACIADRRDDQLTAASVLRRVARAQSTASTSADHATR